MGAALLGDRTIAVFWAFLYDHPGNSEVLIDAILDTWDDEENTEDHETFGSRTGRVDEHPHIASSLVTGGRWPTTTRGSGSS
jgi:hypothetical protein